MASPETGTPDENLSTEHQKESDARIPSDTLDRDQTPDTGEDGDEEKIGVG